MALSVGESWPFLPYPYLLRKYQLSRRKSSVTKRWAACRQGSCAAWCH